MKLSSNFSLNRFGLNIRLVNEDDADFIVELRSDPKLGAFLNPTQNDVERQKQWIKEYKKREEQGLDYYFIYLNNGERIGLNRIYNIKGQTATSGSWICLPNLPFEFPLITVVIIREIFFEILGLQIDYMDTRKDNRKVIKMHLLQGAKEISSNEIDVFHILTKEAYGVNKEKFMSYINLKND